MKLRLYQVDAFTDQVLQGNPAAVCPLDAWLPDRLMQAIANENQLSETAFFVPVTNGYALRWFTPTSEVDLCGHATLATAFVLYRLLGETAGRISFHTHSGELQVWPEGEGFAMQFPAIVGQSCRPPNVLIEGLGAVPNEVWLAEDYMVVFKDMNIIRSLQPDFAILKKLTCRGVIVTARGDKEDFISRFFAPRYGIDEDPVTGSAHCMLAPYWQQRTGKSELTARQVSARGGALRCRVNDKHVTLVGDCALYMRANIEVP